VVAVREKPLRAQGDLKSQGAHNASLVEGSGLPTQGATRNPWVFGADPDNAACRDVGYKASIAAGDLHKSGSSGRRLMDSVVAPYHLVLALGRRVDTNVECTRGKSLIGQTKGSDCSLNSG